MIIGYKGVYVTKIKVGGVLCYNLKFIYHTIVDF